MVGVYGAPNVGPLRTRKGFSLKRIRDCLLVGVCFAIHIVVMRVPDKPAHENILL